MTTKFRTVDSCLSMIVTLTNNTSEQVQEAWAQAQEIHIGWPQNQGVQAFDLPPHRFAIEVFRDGFAVWSIDPETGFAVRL